MTEDFSVTLDFTPVVEAITDFAEKFDEAMSTVSTLAQPRPQREVRELRDVVREHNLDRADRGSARVRRADGSLVAEWNDEELVRFSEVVDDA